MRNKENSWINGRNTSDIHTCVAQLSISWDGTFFSEANHKILVKLNKSCVQNVMTTWCGGLGRPSLGTDAEDFFFQEPVTLTPHLDEVHATQHGSSDRTITVVTSIPPLEWNPNLKITPLDCRTHHHIFSFVIPFNVSSARCTII
jgi:hypothetical protein